MASSEEGHEGHGPLPKKKARASFQGKGHGFFRRRRWSSSEEEGQVKIAIWSGPVQA